MGERQRDGSPREWLTEATTEARRVSWLLESLVPHPTRRGSDNVRHGRLSVSSPAWHAQAAGLVMELHALARELEQTMRLRVSGTDLRRGGSDQNTVRALDALTSLAQAVDEPLVRDTWWRLDRWNQRGRVTLGEVEPLSRLPRLPGRPEPRCPWCAAFTLRFWPVTGSVRCVNPSCRDEEGRRPHAMIEIGALTGDLILIWQDDVSGLPS